MGSMKCADEVGEDPLARVLRTVRRIRKPVTDDTAQEEHMAKRAAAAKRELINTGTDKRYVRRGTGGRFKESDDLGRSLAQDRQRKAKTKVKSGQGDKGDR
jgi:hypothetical protein